MLQLGLGLKAGSLAWLMPAQALRYHEPGPGSWLGLGLAWLQLEPQLLCESVGDPISVVKCSLFIMSWCPCCWCQNGHEQGRREEIPPAGMQQM